MRKLRKGWLCPRCEKVNNPALDQCKCEPVPKIEEGSNLSFVPPAQGLDTFAPEDSDTVTFQGFSGDITSGYSNRGHGGLAIRDSGELVIDERAFFRP